ncbi:MAG: hypothetical protein ACRDJU_09155, partial [Actinomycetota bacterium]
AIADVLGASVEEIFGTEGTEEAQVPMLGVVPSGTVPVLAVRVCDVLAYHPLANRGAAVTS